MCRPMRAAPAPGGRGRARRRRHRDLLQRALPQPPDDRRGGGGPARLPGRVLRRRAGQRLPAPPGPGRAQPLFHPAEERRDRRARSCPAPTPRTPTSTTTARSRSGRTPSAAPTCTSACSTAGRWSAAASSATSSPRWELGATEDLRRRRRPERVRSSRSRRSSCGGSTPGSSRSATCRSRRCAGRSAPASRGSSPGAAPGPPAPRPRRSTRSSAPRTRRCGCATSRTGAALFDEDFSGYPEVEDRREVALDEFAAVAAALHTFAHRARPAGSRPRSRSATPGCTGCATSRPAAERGAPPRAQVAAGPCRGVSGARGIPAAARPARRGRRRRAPGGGAPARRLRILALPRRAAAPGPRLRRPRPRRSDARVGLEPGPRRVAARARPGADQAGRRRTAAPQPAADPTERRSDAQDRFQPEPAPTCTRSTSVGLRLAGLRDTRTLAAGSRIEAPTSIISIVAPGAFLDVGAFCNLSGGGINNVRFGRYCSVATGVVIGPHEHPTDWLTTSRTAYYPAGERLGRAGGRAERSPRSSAQAALHRQLPDHQHRPDVWIGQGAFIKAGVTIGAGAIIGARATVLRDVPPYAVVVGHPGPGAAAALPRGDGRAAAGARMVALLDLRPVRRAVRLDRRARST